VRILYLQPMTFPNQYAHSIQVINTCHALAEAGATVDLYVRRLETRSVREALKYYGLAPHPRLSICQFTMTRLKPSGKWRGLLFRFSIRRLLARYASTNGAEANKHVCLLIREPDIAARCMSTARQYGIPVILETHRGSIFREAKDIDLSEREKHKHEQEQERQCYAQASGIICITHAHRNCLENDPLVSASCSVIPDGAGSTCQPSAKRDLDILYAGQLYPWKGVGTAIRAMEYLPQYRLTVVGGNVDDQLQKLKDLAVSLGIDSKVTFVGHVPPVEVAKYLARAKVGVVPLPSAGHAKARKFTSPLKVFEYMAAGLPIVGSDLPSLREVLTHEDNAILVNPDDPEALAEGIRRVLEDQELSIRLSCKAIQDAQQYSWRQRARRIMEFVEENA